MRQWIWMPFLYARIPPQQDSLFLIMLQILRILNLFFAASNFMYTWMSLKWWCEQRLTNKAKWQILRRFYSACVKKESKKIQKVSWGFLYVTEPLLFPALSNSRLFLFGCSTIAFHFCLYLTYCLVFIVELRNDKLKAWTEEFIRSFHHWAEALRFGMWFTCVFHVIFALCGPALFCRELMVAVFVIISLFQVPVICMCGTLRILFLCWMCPLTYT